MSEQDTVTSSTWVAELEGTVVYRGDRLMVERWVRHRPLLDGWVAIRSVPLTECGRRST